MHPLIWLRARNPYDGFYKLAGGKPQILAHADDLSTGTIATWSGRGGVNLTGNGSPTVNASGWSGSGISLKTAKLVSTSSQYFSFDSEASSYKATTPFIWVLAATVTASAAARNALFLGYTGNNVNYRGWTVQATNDYAYLSSNRNGTGEFDTDSVAVTETSQSIVVISLAGGNALIRQATSSGSTTLLNTTHTMSGTMLLDKFTLGCLYATSPLNYTGMNVRFLACLRSPSVTHDITSIDKVIAWTRYRLRCPL